MKARAVDGLDPHASLADNARLIMRVRTDELYSFIPAALDEGDVTALHDMRIAAKRLRYVLELVGFCFGPYADRARAHARDLHSLIGEIHDCDVLLPRLEELREQAGPGIDELIRRYRELRRERFTAFREAWAAIEGEGMREQLFAALDARNLSVGMEPVT
jgi:CHAD domain-containing protein